MYDDDEALIPIAAAAKRLNVSPRTIRRWRDAGRLADGDCELVGSRWKMRPAAVEAIAAGGYAGLHLARR